MLSDLMQRGSTMGWSGAASLLASLWSLTLQFLGKIHPHIRRHCQATDQYRPNRASARDEWSCVDSNWKQPQTSAFCPSVWPAALSARQSVGDVVSTPALSKLPLLLCCTVSTSETHGQLLTGLNPVMYMYRANHCAPLTIYANPESGWSRKLKRFKLSSSVHHFLLLSEARSKCRLDCHKSIKNLPDSIILVGYTAKTVFKNCIQ